jgi:hypothetical protein
LESTALTLTFQSPLTPSHPLGPYYITTTTSTISVFLFRNNHLSVLQALGQGSIGCRMATADGHVVALAGTWFWARKAMVFVSHSVHLSRNMDDDSNCEASIIQFPNGKTKEGQKAQAIYGITLREEFT